MGAALLVRYGRRENPHGQHELQRVADAFPRRIRELERTDKSTERHAAMVWRHQSCRTPGFIEDASTGSWLVLVGNPARRDLTALSGEAVLERLLAECLESGPSTLAEMSPPFAAVFYDGRTGRMSAAVDRIGFQHLYVREEDDATWLASSSLALGTGMPSRLDENAPGEWLGIGNFVSQRTFFREVRKLACGELVTIDDGGCTSTTWHPDEEGHSAQGRPLDEFVEKFLQAVDDYAHGPGLFSELTAGLDSRLVLAALLHRGEPFSTWTVGRSSWEELETVRKLQQKVSFEHLLVEVGPELGERLPALVEEMHELADGEANALAYSHLLVAFEALDGRRVTSITGTAGEIARGFYYSVIGAGGPGERDVALEALVAKTTRPTKILHGAVLSGPIADPREAARRVLADFIRTSSAQTEVGILEDLYLRGRLQRFAGRNFSTTGYFCRQALPYFENEFVDLVFSLPTETKERGWIVREALRTLSPSLATVPLTAGDPVSTTLRLAPRARFRRSLALARRAAARYGGRRARQLVARGVENLPGDFARQSPTFELYARDLILTPSAKINDLVRPGKPLEVLEAALRGGSLYPLGLLLTLELTLRRAAAAGTRG